MPVALCVERSLEMVIGILGILKAGGASCRLTRLSPRALGFHVGGLSGSGHAHSATSAGKPAALQAGSSDLPGFGMGEDCPQPHSSMLEDLKPENLAGDLHLRLDRQTKAWRLRNKTWRNRLPPNSITTPAPGNEFLLLSSFAFTVQSLLFSMPSFRAGIGPARLRNSKWKLVSCRSDCSAPDLEHALHSPALLRTLETVDAQRLASLHQVIVAGEVCSRQLVACITSCCPRWNYSMSTDRPKGRSGAQCTSANWRSWPAPCRWPADCQTRGCMLRPECAARSRRSARQSYITGAGVAAGYRNRRTSPVEIPVQSVCRGFCWNFR